MENTVGFRTALILLLTAIFAVPVVVFAQLPSGGSSFPSTRSVGFVDKDGKYRIFTDLGIEQWEEGKLTTHRYQTWHISCGPEGYGAKLQFDLWCYVERIIIDGDLTDKGTKAIGARNHSFSENTLKLTNVNLPEGRLDFTLIFDDGSTVEAALRFKRWRDSLFLDSFKAIGISRGIFSDTLSAIEYRIPEYDYVLNFAVEMRGMKTQDIKARDDFEKSLSAIDRQRWLTVSKSIPVFDSTSIRKYVPDYKEIDTGTRSLTARDIELFEKGMKESLTSWLIGTQMSPDGRTKAYAFLVSIIESIILEFRKDLVKK
jgi:hypothetical protein